MSSDDTQDSKKKKGGFFKKAFGFKSKEDKLAEAAAIKAEQQAQVDAQMAQRMAAINAAALKAARAQDEQNLNAAQAERLEQEEKRRAEEQAEKDVAAAKRLIEEKRLAGIAAKEQAARIAAEKLAAEQQAEQDRLAKTAADKAAKIATDKLATEQAVAERARAKAEKSALAKASAEQAAALKIQQDKDRAERAAADKLAAETLAAKQLAAEQVSAETRAQQRQAEQALADKKLAADKLAAEQAHAEKMAAEKLASRELAARTLAAEKAAQEAAAKAPAAGTQTEPERPGFLGRISEGLKKSTSRMSENISDVFNKRKLDDAALEDLEDILIAADFGIGPAGRTAALLAKDKFDKQVTDMEIKIALADVIGQTLAPLEKPLTFTGAKPEIMLFVGVNGSGKTTTLGKLAARYKKDGKKVLMCAGDTFRAAAVEQLNVWGERAGAPVVSAPLGADASGLVFDAMTRAKSEGFDILMIDTAGRLQNRTELMDELSKIVRVIKKHDETAPHHSILVLDATVGQNALLQTEAFSKTAGITGLIMTKLDGTAKGGVLVALADKFKLPIHAIGIGEGINDLENFSAPVFAAALSGVADAVVEG